MKTSPLEGALKRNTQSAAVNQASIAWIVANILSKGYDSSEACGLETKLHPRQVCLLSTHHPQRKATATGNHYRQPLIQATATTLTNVLETGRELAQAVSAVLQSACQLMAMPLMDC